MKISFIGNGNVGHHLMQAFSKAGHSIEEIYSRTQSLQNFGNSSDLIVISISDDAIAMISEQLKFHTTPIVHTAGSVDISVLESEHHSYGVLYPLQTFSKEREMNYAQIPYFIECSDDVLRRKLESLIASTQAKSQYINSAQRMQLHIAAVFACNFSNFMFDLAAGLLRKNEIPFETLMPLIQECVNKLQSLSPEIAQTGPAKRGDASTQQKHLKALESEPIFSEIYTLISREIQKKYNQSK